MNVERMTILPFEYLTVVRWVDGFPSYSQFKFCLN